LKLADARAPVANRTGWAKTEAWILAFHVSEPEHPVPGVRVWRMLTTTGIPPQSLDAEAEGDWK
jgi:hypothetical protein